MHPLLCWTSLTAACDETRALNVCILASMYVWRCAGQPEYLSEDPSLTTYFFLGVMGWGDGDIQMSRRRGRRRDPPNGRGSPMLKIGLQTYFLDFPVDD